VIKITTKKQLGAAFAEAAGECVHDWRRVTVDYHWCVHCRKEVFSPSGRTKPIYHKPEGFHAAIELVRADVFYLQLDTCNDDSYEMNIERNNIAYDFFHINPTVALLACYLKAKGIEFTLELTDDQD